MEHVQLSEPDQVDAIISFLSNFSIETHPKQAGRISNFGDYLDRGRRVFIAHIAGTPYDELIDLAARLRKEGFEPVMHVTARDLPSKNHLNEVLAKYTGEAGGRELLLIAGDMPTPTGEFDDTLKVLRTGLFEQHGIKRMGLAGHPEGTKAISDERLRQAIIDKNAHAEQSDIEFMLVTQFGFEPQPFIDWEKRLRTEGINKLPIRIGIPGLASFPTLLRFAIDCGVGASVRALQSRAGSLAKLATVAQPDELVAGLARHKSTDPATCITAPHFFPFGGVKSTAEWLNAILAGKISIKKDGPGFSVR